MPALGCYYLFMALNFATVVPTQKIHFSELEKARLDVTMRNSPEIIFVVPNRNLEEFRWVNGSQLEIVAFDDVWFDSRQTYNALLLTESFWSYFGKFQKILICQLDAILIKPIDNLVKSDFAYIGSAWNPAKKCRLLNGKLYVDYRKQFMIPFRRIEIGNGGLSLRNIGVMALIVRYIKGQRNLTQLLTGQFNEDIVFSYFLNKFKISVPSKEESDRYFLEAGSARLQEIPDVYGFHGLERFNPSLEKLVLEKYCTSN